MNPFTEARFWPVYTDAMVNTELSSNPTEMKMSNVVTKTIVASLMVLAIGAATVPAALAGAVVTQKVTRTDSFGNTVTKQRFVKTDDFGNKVAGVRVTRTNVFGAKVTKQKVVRTDAFGDKVVKSKVVVSF